MDNLSTFEPTAGKGFVKDGDFSVRDNLNKPLIISVVEMNSGVKTPFNQDPGTKGYKPEGQDVVNIDVADVKADEIYIHAGLFQPALVDQLKGYIGHDLAIKFVSVKAKSGYSYFTVEPLAGAELTAAEKWAGKNDTRFADRRSELEAEAGIESTGIDSHTAGLIADLARSQAA